METNEVIQSTTKGVKKFTESLTWKLMIIGFLTLLMLIPAALIQNQIRERESTGEQKVAEINKSWSGHQTVSPPTLVIPYTTCEIIDDSGKTALFEHELQIAPESSSIVAELQPEVRHISIYKSIVYRSDIKISGEFAAATKFAVENAEMHYDRAQVVFSLSDLRGLEEEFAMNIDGKKTRRYSDANGNSEVMFPLGNIFTGKGFKFDCKFKLKGSVGMDFLPLARTTKVSVSGAWKSPGFVGSFLPQYSIDAEKKTFNAEWKVLSFNHNIPYTRIDSDYYRYESSAFGVNLTDPIDIYLLNLRSAKYALLFILLTFAVFFFVEALTKKRIHPIQYLLVGVAIIVFYTLLLAFSEQIGFAVSYLVAALATISLITTYALSVFGKRKPAMILAGVLVGLYTFLYVILQLEDVALLCGSIGLFIILGAIMYVSNKVRWYKE